MDTFEENPEGGAWYWKQCNDFQGEGMTVKLRCKQCNDFQGESSSGASSPTTSRERA